MKTEIYNKLNSKIDDLFVRYDKNKMVLGKKYETFSEKIEDISEASKMMVVESLLQVYKFAHSIQITRWVGLNHEDIYSDEKYLDAWSSASKALERRMKLERSLKK